MYCAATREPLDWYARLVALHLSAPGVVVTGDSALGLYGVIDAPSTAELIVPRSRRNLERTVVHSTVDLPPTDVTVVRALPATTPSRTLVIAADGRTIAQTQELISKVVIRKLVRLEAVQRRARDLVCAGRPGAGRVLRALEDMHPGFEQARNDWEGRVLLALARHDIPSPEVNYVLRFGADTRVLDFAWPLAKVFLEFDGYWEHLMSRPRFDDDRRRDNQLEDLGWKGYKVTSTMLRARGGLDEVVRAVRRRSPS